MQELGDLWLNNVESGAWRAFLSVHSRLMTALNDELIERTGLSLAEYEVLVHLSEAEQRSMRMNE
jgi:DNA-binding MarR family transcriptional regulator